MADGHVQVAPDSTGKKVDNTEVTRADGTVVERQRIDIGDESDLPKVQTRLLHEILLELQRLRLALLDALH